MDTKIIRDGHIHSHYCPHGCSDPFTLYIENALHHGLQEITFTEHLPLPKNFSDPSPLHDSAIRMEDIGAYIDEVNHYKQKYKEQIKINLGFEVDYLQGFESETTELLETYGKHIDDSIISLHMLKIKEDYHLVDFDTKLFANLISEAGDLQKAYLHYYTTLVAMIKADLGKYKPKRIGHFNLIRKFQKTFPYNYTVHHQLFETIFALIKEKGMELDYNVSGLRKEDCGEIYVPDLLLDLATKNNIPLVFGSDSHSAEWVGIIPAI